MILDIYNNQIKIDKDKLKKLTVQKNIKMNIFYQKFFNKDQNLNLKEKVKAIKQSIKNVGFNNTASIYSMSNSANSEEK